MRRHLFPLLLPLLLTACNLVNQGPEPTGRIEVSPGSQLLTAPGESFELSALVFDGRGNLTNDEVTWHSSDPAVVAVDADGFATAVSSVGSAQVVARARGLESAPVLVLVAQTVPGAVLAADEQVESEIAPVDATAEYDLGWQYRVVLAGLAPLSAGDLLIGTGELPLGGRVIDSSPHADGQLVTLEIVALDELFVELRIQESLDLSNVEPVIAEELSQSYEIRELPNGSLQFTPRPSDAGSMTPLQLSEGTRALGPFECETNTTFDLELAAQPSFTVDPSLSFDFDYDLAQGGLKKLATKGSLAAEFKFEPTLTAALEGSRKCEAELFLIPVPIGGPMAFVVGGHVPIGVGFELKGKVTLAQLGLQTSATGTAELELGINCPVPGECDTFATGDANLEAKVTPKFPDIPEQFRVEAEFSVFAYADVALGTRLFKKLRLQALRFTASAKQNLNLATAHAQVADPAYASTFDLSLIVQAKVGKDVEKVLRFLKFKLNALSFDLVDKPIAQSPRGSFSITPGSVAPGSDGALGHMATFRIELDPVTYITADSVEKVEIFWKKEGEAGSIVLENGRPGCAEVSASSGQTTFECQTDFLEEHEGIQTFYAFVHAKLFGITLPVPLEVANDGMATVNVDPEAIGPEICETLAREHYLDENPSGDGVATTHSYRKVSARSNNGLAEAETYDFVAVIPSDSSLGGQDGYLRVRFRYRFESTGPSETSPAARVSLYPLQIYRSFHLFHHYAGSEPKIVDEVVERDVHIRFVHIHDNSITGGTPVGIGAETFRSGGGLVKAEAEWLGIVNVLDSSRNPVAVDRICSSSGTSYE